MGMYDDMVSVNEWNCGNRTPNFYSQKSYKTYLLICVSFALGFLTCYMIF